MMDHPAPLTPKDADLRAFEFMPLDVSRFRKSRALAILPAEHFMPWFSLILESWHQLPAASIPDDDVELAALAGFGRQMDQWLQARDGALYGWVKCSDGRFYHPVVAEKANEAWLSRLNERYRKHAYREKKSEREAKPFDEWLATASPDTFAIVHGCPRDGTGTNGNVPGTERGQTAMSQGQSPNSHGKTVVSGVERERERDRDREILDSGGAQARRSDDESKTDLDALLYRRGKALLGKNSGGQITKLKEQLGVGSALEALETAKRKENPSEYIAGIIRKRARANGKLPFDPTTQEGRDKCVEHHVETGDWHESWGTLPNEDELTKARLRLIRAGVIDSETAETADEMMKIPRFLDRRAKA